MAPSPAHAQKKTKQVEGMAVFVSAHTLILTTAGGATFTIRLFGIDAPEMAMVPHGPWARGYAQDFVQGAKVRCGLLGRMQNKRLIGICTMAEDEARQVDLSFALVRAGWAWRHSADENRPAIAALDAAERDARKAQRGIWRGYRP